MTELKQKWYKTKGGKIGIILFSATILTTMILLVRKYKKEIDELEKDKFDSNLEKDNKIIETNEIKSDVPIISQLPNEGKECGEVKTNFDRIYNYVKCNGVWWTISKDKVRIPEWKSLENNKTATDLLNNKYKD